MDREPTELQARQQGMQSSFLSLLTEIGIASILNLVFYLYNLRGRVTTN